MSKRKPYPWIMQHCDCVHRNGIVSDKGTYQLLVYQNPSTKEYYLVKVKQGKVVETHNLSTSPKEQIFRNVFKNGNETIYYMITRVHRGDQVYLKVMIEAEKEGTSKYDVFPLM